MSLAFNIKKLDVRPTGLLSGLGVVNRFNMMCEYSRSDKVIDNFLGGDVKCVYMDRRVRVKRCLPLSCLVSFLNHLRNKEHQDPQR
jgi:hypothetical protein